VRVAVTAGPDTAERIGRELHRVGLRPVWLPCVEIAPVPEETLRRVRRVATDVDWILVTSARAVQVVWPHGGMPPVPVAAVGPTTARAVAAAGGDAQLVGSDGAAALVERLGRRAADATVLFPRAAQVAADVVGLLEGHRCRVLSEVVYTTRPIPPPSQPPVEAATFASPSAVDGWTRTRPLAGIVRAALGSTTADALAAAGYPADVVAPVPRPVSLADALYRHLEERRDP